MLAVVAAFAAALTLGLAAGGPDLTLAWIADVGRVHEVRWNPLNASWAGFTARIGAGRLVSVGLWIAGAAAIALTAARRLAAPLTSDQRWSLLGTTTLLVSPVGWVYYLPLFYGPLLGALRGSAGLLVGGAIIALSLPPPVVFLDTPGVLGMASAASVFMWGALALWLAVLRTSRPP